MYAFSSIPTLFSRSLPSKREESAVAHQGHRLVVCKVCTGLCLPGGGELGEVSFGEEGRAVDLDGESTQSNPRDYVMNIG